MDAIISRQFRLLITFSLLNGFYNTFDFMIFRVPKQPIPNEYLYIFEFSNVTERKRDV